jgi:hypothetical protein
VLGLLIIVLAHRVSLTHNTIIGAIIAVLVVYYLNEKDMSLGNNYLTEMDKILSYPVFKKSKNLYRDSEILIFLGKHLYFNHYNPALFRKLVKHIDNFLRMGKDLNTSPPPVNFNMDFENMLAERENIMNAYHSFVYSLPHTPVIVEQYQNGMQLLANLLDKNISDARLATLAESRDKGVNVSTSFFYKGHPGGLDKAATNYNYF